MRSIGILGSGAIGSFIAGVLSSIQNSSSISRVCLCGFYEDHLQSINTHGLSIKSPHEPENELWRHLSTMNLGKWDKTNSIYNIKFDTLFVKDETKLSSKFDKIIICDKTYNNTKWLNYLPSLSKDSTDFFLLQNGGGNYEFFKKYYLTNSIIYGYLTYGFSILSPSIISHGGSGSITMLYNYQYDLDNISKWGEYFDKSKVPYVIEKNINRNKLLWYKLVVNNSINTLTTLYQLKNGDLLKNDIYMREMYEIIDEILTIMKSISILMTEEDINMIRQLPFKIAEATTKNTSSMLSDYLNGFPLEIDSILNYVINIGLDHQCHIPKLLSIQQRLYTLIQERDNHQNK